MTYYEDGFGGFEYHQAPSCPWCGSQRTWAEFGMYDACLPAQLSPYTCQDCGAVEFWSQDDPKVASDEERRMGWFKAPEFEPPAGIAVPDDLFSTLSTTEFMEEATRAAERWRGEPL